MTNTPNDPESQRSQPQPEYAPPTQPQPQAESGSQGHPYPQPQTQYAPPVQPYPQRPSVPKGLAVSALVVGIISFLMGLVPLFGAIVGIVAVVLGAIALSKKQPKGLALTGLILGAVATISSFAMLFALGGLVGEVSSTSVATSAPMVEQQVEESEEDAVEETPGPAPAPAPQPTERLTLDEGWTTEADEFGFALYVNGYVSNNSDRAVTNYVQITFDTLDAQGANLGTCLANTNTIDAGGKWKFEAICMDDPAEVTEVRFKEISGF